MTKKTTTTFESVIPFKETTSDSSSVTATIIMNTKIVTIDYFYLFLPFLIIPGFCHLSFNEIKNTIKLVTIKQNWIKLKLAFLLNVFLIMSNKNLKINFTGKKMTDVLLQILFYSFDCLQLVLSGLYFIYFKQLLRLHFSLIKFFAAPKNHFLNNQWTFV